jgi:Tfp pilus assembly protein PilO
VNKKAIAIAAAVSVVLVGIWYIAIFSKQSKSLHTAHIQVAAANSQAAGLRADIAVLQQEKAQLPAATSKLDVLKLALPNTPALDKLIDDVNAAAAQSGVDWQNVSQTKPATFAAATPQGAGAYPGGMQAVNVSMQVSGGYKQVTDFVSKLMTISRLLTVTSVNLNGVGATAPKTTGQITTQMFFIQPPAGTAAATATP